MYYLMLLFIMPHYGYPATAVIPQASYEQCQISTEHAKRLYNGLLRNANCIPFGSVLKH